MLTCPLEPTVRTWEPLHFPLTRNCVQTCWPARACWSLPVTVPGVLVVTRLGADTTTGAADTLVRVRAEVVDVSPYALVDVMRQE